MVILREIYYQVVSNLYRSVLILSQHGTDRLCHLRQCGFLLDVRELPLPTGRLLLGDAKHGFGLVRLATADGVGDIVHPFLEPFPA